MSHEKISGIPSAIIEFIKHYDLKLEHVIVFFILVALYFGNPSREDHEGYVRHYIKETGIPSRDIVFKDWYIYSVVYHSPEIRCARGITLNLSNPKNMVSCTDGLRASEMDYKKMQPLTYGLLWKIFETDAFILLQTSDRYKLQGSELIYQSFAGIDNEARRSRTAQARNSPQNYRRPQQVAFLRGSV